jgi:1,4-alpha-glucan branching enzyme
MIAEESTAFPGVTKPVHLGGLGFGYKWMMGWMNDTLRYFERDPIHRRYHHNEISFSMAYANSENYILPLSHDEVVYGKKALLDKMPGDEWQRFAELRLLYTYMFTHPGGKLIFMGGEIGQVAEWNINEQLEWFVMDYPLHKGISDVIKDLNGLYRSEPALHEKDHDPSGFNWIDHSDHENCILAYTRQCEKEEVVVVLNFTPQTLTNYRIGVDKKGEYKEIFNSDRAEYQGSGQKNEKVKAEKTESHGRQWSLNLTLPPLGGIVLKNK